MLNGRNATPHWEDLEDIGLQFPRIKLKRDRFVIDGEVFTIGGASPTFYRRLRLRTARRLIVDTRLCLREVAIRTGFNSLPAFSRMFKQYYQQAPGECREFSGEMVILP